MQNTKALFVAMLRQALGEMRKLRSQVGAALLAALGIVLKMLTININQFLRTGLSFLPIALAGWLYGPFLGGLTAVIIDILGFLLNPTGPYFFGFTLNAFINGMLYGFWLYGRPVRLWRCLGGVFSSIAVISFGLNPLWLNILYGESYIGLVLLRVPTNAIVLPVNTLLLYMLLKSLEKAKPLLAQRGK